MVEVGLAVRADPLVIEVGLDAAVRVVEREHGAAVIVEVGVRAVELPRGVDLAAQAVDAGMVVGPATALIIIAVIVVAVASTLAGTVVTFGMPGPVIRAPRCIGEGAEVVVERVILLHEDD